LILADTEGYTAHGRASDGRDVYVARMYLFETEAVVPVGSAASCVVGAVGQTGLYLGRRGPRGCDELSAQADTLNPSANGVPVQVSIQDSGGEISPVLRFRVIRPHKST
jgi:hypothetical protein